MLVKLHWTEITAQILSRNLTQPWSQPDYGTIVLFCIAHSFYLFCVRRGGIKMYSEVVQSAVYKIEYERKNENRGREKRVKGKKMVNDGILKNALLFFCDTQFSATFVFFFLSVKTRFWSAHSRESLGCSSGLLWPVLHYEGPITLHSGYGAEYGVITNLQFCAYSVIYETSTCIHFL